MVRRSSRVSGRLRLAFVALAAAAAVVGAACGGDEEPTAVPTRAAVAAPTPAATAVAPVATAAAPVATAVRAVPTVAPIVGAGMAEVAKGKGIPGGKMHDLADREVATWDVTRVVSILDITTTANVHNGLMWYPEADFNIACELCESWELTDSGKLYTFRLHQGVLFHDGKELTAEDVAWTMNKWMGRVDGFGNPRLEMIDDFVDDVSAPEKYTLEVKMNFASAAFLSFLSTDYATVTRETAPEVHKLTPTGTGPYIVKEFVPGAGYRLEKNPNYFKDGLPYLDALDRLLVRGREAQRAAIITGQLDWIVGLGPQQATWPKMKSMIDEGRLRFWSEPHMWMHQMWINHHNDSLKDVRVRKAMQLAMD